MTCDFLTLWEHIHQFGSVAYRVINNVATQLDDCYGFGINFDGTKHTSEYN